MITYGENIKIFCGNSNPEFAKNICKDLGVDLGKAEVKTFADGEACWKPSAEQTFSWFSPPVSLSTII